MIHDPIACGITRQVTDEDGCQVIITRSCIHGRSVTERIGTEWVPGRELGAMFPTCPKCERPVVQDREARIDGQPSHLKCMQEHDRNRAEAERVKAFIVDWNGGMHHDTLLIRYGWRHRKSPDNYAVRLRRLGHQLIDRRKTGQRPIGAKGHSRPPTPAMVEVHERGMAGAFG